MIEGIHYLNSGDWVETMSALAEDHEGNWQLIYYREIDFRDIQNDLQQHTFQSDATIVPMRQVSFETRNDEDITPPNIRLQ